MRTMIVLLVAGSVAVGDEVTLKSGGKFSGIAEEKGDQVVLRTEHGTMTFAKDQVAKIDRAKSSPLQEFQEMARRSDLAKAGDVESLLAFAEARKMAEPARELRERLAKLKWEALDKADSARLEEFAAWARANGAAPLAEQALRTGLGLLREKLPPKDAEARYRLGLWARTHGLAADALVLFQDALALDSEHEFARRALGYQLHQGRWMTETEVKQAMGLLLFEGEWMTPRAREAVIEARTLEKERKLLEEARKRLEEERKLAAAEFEQRRAELDRRSADLARQLAELEQRRRLAALPPCGWHGCGIAAVHGHCGRAGCLMAGVHAHCARLGCAVAGPHAH